MLIKITVMVVDDTIILLKSYALMSDHMTAELAYFSKLNHSATWHFCIIMATAKSMVIEVTEAESEDITASTTASNNGRSLLDVLKPTTKSDLGRKRKIERSTSSQSSGRKTSTVANATDPMKIYLTVLKNFLVSALKLGMVNCSA